MPTLAERISKRMEHLKLSAQVAAKGAGTTRQSVYLWLRGDTKALKGATLLRLARTLQCSPDWLATGKGDLDGQGQPGGASDEAREIAAAWDMLPEMKRRIYREAILHDAAIAEVFPEISGKVATSASYHAMIAKFRKDRVLLERQMKLKLDP